jgi:hypothetical protein
MINLEVILVNQNRLMEVQKDMEIDKYKNPD